MNKKPFKRCDRVAVELKKVISDLLHKDMGDPRLKNITITGVNLSRDLRIAKVYFAFYEGRGKTEKSIIRGFWDAKGYIKREVARKMQLRYMPDISFFHDRSIDYGAHMNEVLGSLDSVVIRKWER